MIRNGYFYPIEAFNSLTHIDGSGTIVGDAQVAISLGNRSAGKTVGYAIELIKRYEQYGERCCLLTRTAEDMKSGYLEKWWGDKIFTIKDQDGIIQNFVERHEIKYTPTAVFVDGDPMCYCAPISMSAKVKDTYGFSNCRNVIMDEAIQIGERVLYLGSPARPAMSRIFEIYQTIARGYDKAEQLTHLIFIANTSERDNWIFNDLNINSFVREDTKRTCQNGVYVEIIRNKIVSKKIDNSLIGEVMRQSVSGRAYYESAQNNAFLDNKAFVQKEGLDFKTLRIQIRTGAATIGIFRVGDKWHAAKIAPDKRSQIITTDPNNHSEDVTYSPDTPWTEALSEAYRGRYLTFSTQETKGLLLAWLGLTR